MGKVYIETEKSLSDRSLRFLLKHGPQRHKPMVKSLKTSYRRLNSVLNALVDAGKVERTPDGVWRGETAYTWAVRGDARLVKVEAAVRFSFGGQETLLAFQRAALTHYTHAGVQA